MGRLTVDANEKFSEAVAGLRFSLLKAVEARATRYITGDLSGGIDSSTLIFLSLRAGVDVSAFTFHHVIEVEDDLSWARHFARLASGLRHHFVPATDDDLPFQHLAAASEYPHASSFAVGPLRARLRLAVESG